MKNIAKGPFILLTSRDVYRNPWISVREDKVIRPGGTEGIFGVVEMKAGSSVLALTDDNEVFLVREYKYGIEHDSIESISGAIDGSETPLETAKRELKEELGLEASEWIDLGIVNPFTTIINSPNYMFLARGLTVGENNPDDGEILHTIKMPFSEVVDMVMNGEITHSASCVLVLKAERYLNQQN